MAAVDIDLVVRDANGVLHHRNPLGVDICLGCTLPFPCPATVAGEQLDLLAVTS